MEENEEDKTNQNDSKHNGSCLVNIINEIVDCATCQSVLPSTSSSLPEQNNSFQTSPPIEQRLIVSRPSEATRNNYYVHNTPLGHYKSEGIIVDNKSEISKSFTQIPPSYSTVIKLPPLVNNNRNRINIHPSISFISRQPPPSYQEVHGSFQESLSRSTISSDSFVTLGPDPIYLICPRCATFVVSRTHSRRTKVTYFASLLLCLCLCWPCCVLPFWVKACQDVEHTCPNCNYFFGTHTTF